MMQVVIISTVVRLSASAVLGTNRQPPTAATPTHRAVDELTDRPSSHPFLLRYQPFV